MHLIPLTSISIPPNRQRRVFPQESMNDLSESIRKHGLYHPIVVAPDGEGYRLVAGERRFRAISSLAELEISFTSGTGICPAGSIPITLLSELDSFTLREIELEENTIRVDLTWQERANAIAELDAFRKEQRPGHTSSDTAREIGLTQSGISTVKESVLLSRAMTADPEIAKAKSHNEAMKLFTKKAEAANRERLAANVTITNDHYSILQGDSREILTSLPSGRFDCIITDPPYGIGADRFGSQATTGHSYLDTPEYAIDCYRTLVREGFRVCAEQAHAYIFCSIEQFSAVSVLLSSAGWSVWPRPLIWYKGNGMLPRPEYGPRCTYEAILFATKGDKKVWLPGQHDVLSYPSPTDKIHAAEKPGDLLVDLLSRSCTAGDHILDPFAGSGSTFLAAGALKLKATGIELDPVHVASCKLRIKGIV